MSSNLHENFISQTFIPLSHRAGIKKGEKSGGGGSHLERSLFPLPAETQLVSKLETGSREERGIASLCPLVQPCKTVCVCVCGGRELVPKERKPSSSLGG